MTPSEYLQNILSKQTLDPQGDELADLKNRQQEVIALLNREFPGADMTISVAGSFAKETMIRESYDLDLTCYFGNDDTSAGDTLEDIYNGVRKALEKDFRVGPKTSALRLRSCQKDSLDKDFHIDVVPGRYSGTERADVFLFLKSRDKCRLKTNLGVQIQHIRFSGCRDEIRLMKLWNATTGLALKTFVLELAVIKILKLPEAPWGVAERLRFALEYLRDNADSFTVEDPANPTGNDLSEYLDSQVRARVKRVATRTLNDVDRDGWEGVFGPVEEVSRTRRAAAIVSVVRENPSRPWLAE